VNGGELNFERTTMILAGAIVGMFFFVCGALGYFIFWLTKQSGSSKSTDAK
jgi:hypothetical protein